MLKAGHPLSGGSGGSVPGKHLPPEWFPSIATAAVAASGEVQQRTREGEVDVPGEDGEQHQGAAGQGEVLGELGELQLLLLGIRRCPEVVHDEGPVGMTVPGTERLRKHHTPWAASRVSGAVTSTGPGQPAGVARVGQHTVTAEDLLPDDLRDALAQIN
jgi:hypothetical protein